MQRLAPRAPVDESRLAGTRVEVARAAAEGALMAMTAEEVAEIVRHHMDPHVDLQLLDPAGALSGPQNPATLPGT